MAKKQAGIERTDKYSWAVEGARARISSGRLLAGEECIITQRPSSEAAVVEFGAGQREYIPIRHLEQVVESLSPQCNHKTDKDILTLEEIAIDGGTQSRACLNDATVDDYAEAMDGGAEFPPLLVFYDGEKYWLADGFHRLAAAKKLEWGEIKASVRQGTRREAVLYSVGANATHGLRRTNADKRRAVTTLLGDEEWSQWSNREIAKACGVSLNLVNTLRKESSELKVQIDDDRLVMRNGKSYTMNTSNIGKSSSGLTGDIPSEDRPDSTTPPPEIEQIIEPQDLVREPKSKHKQLLPSMERNGDVPPGEMPPMPASVVNMSAIVHGKADSVVTDISIGIRQLSPEEFAQVLENGIGTLGAEHWKAAIKVAKKALNQMYHPEYFKGESA